MTASLITFTEDCRPSPILNRIHTSQKTVTRTKAGYVQEIFDVLYNIGLLSSLRFGGRQSVNNPTQKFPCKPGICLPAILVLRRLNQKGHKSKGSLGYRAKLYSMEKENCQADMVVHAF